jgi:4-alpha-glucanotransferase
MARARLDTWQVLPLHPVGAGFSPYSSPSAFAADPRLISVEALVADGWLEPSAMPWGLDAVDHDAVAAWKLPLLRQAARRATVEGRRWAEGRAWVEEWAAYAALARAHGPAWWTWPDEGADPQAMDEEIALQWLFDVQWQRLRADAASRGIRILGDMPIFVNGDACDVWAHRELFLLDRAGRPDPVAGVPPDYFSPTGQRWGNPMYAWKRHAEDEFSWWKARLSRELELVDRVRLDHFRGYVAAWAIAADEPDARNGKWVKGPGRALFDALGGLPLVAEDLGDITPEVRRLRERLGLPGMKILQFAFGTDASHAFLPHNFEGTNWVAYTGTHDNDTAVGWYASADEVTRHRFRVWTGRDGSDPAWALLREAWASVAETAVAPMADVLRLGSGARINTPGVAAGNWTWRLRELPWQTCEELRQLGETFGRG